MTRAILKLNKSKISAEKLEVKTPPPKAKIPPPKAKIPPPKRLSKKQTRKQFMALLKILEINHSDLFPKEGVSPKPWKIGIQKDIRKRYEVTNRISKIALSYWRQCNRSAYIAVLVPGAVRYDLDGEVAGEVEKVWYSKYDVATKRA